MVKIMKRVFVVKKLVTGLMIGIAVVTIGMPSMADEETEKQTEKQIESIELNLEKGVYKFNWGTDRETIMSALSDYNVDGYVGDLDTIWYSPNVTQTILDDIIIDTQDYIFNDEGLLYTGGYSVHDDTGSIFNRILSYYTDLYGKPIKHDDTMYSWDFSGNHSYSGDYMYLSKYDDAVSITYHASQENKETESRSVEEEETELYKDETSLETEDNNPDNNKSEKQETVDSKFQDCDITLIDSFPFGEIDRATIKQKIKENGYIIVDEKENAITVDTKTNLTLDGVEVYAINLERGLVVTYFFQDDICNSLIISNIGSVSDYYDMNDIDYDTRTDINGFIYYEFPAKENTALIQSKEGVYLLRDKTLLHDLKTVENAITYTILAGTSTETILKQIEDYNHAIEKELPSSWEKTYYRDEFGDPTDEVIYLYTTEGTFSNTATDGSNVDVAVVYDPSDCSFRFHFKEYGRSDALFLDTPKIKVKCGNDVVAESGMSTSSDYEYAFLRNTGYVALLNALRENKPLKVAVVCGNSKYIFEL